MADSGRRHSRSRSRSPRRQKKSKSNGGFKWKERAVRETDQVERTGRVGGYRDRDGEKSRKRDHAGRDDGRGENVQNAEESQQQRSKVATSSRDRDRDAEAPIDVQEQTRTHDKTMSSDSKDTPAPTLDSDILSKFGASAAAKFSKSASGKTANKDKEAPSESQVDTAKSVKPKTTTASGPRPGEPMILVKINDRLGTAAQIPCFASDNVGLFKAQVAAKIGRRPHEIMLKRQGERPFKDMLTLEDYGVSNGVQIDLELAT